MLELTNKAVFVFVLVAKISLVKTTRLLITALKSPRCKRLRHTAAWGNPRWATAAAVVFVWRAILIKLKAAKPTFSSLKHVTRFCLLHPKPHIKEAKWLWNGVVWLSAATVAPQGAAESAWTSHLNQGALRRFLWFDFSLLKREASKKRVFSGKFSGGGCRGDGVEFAAGILIKCDVIYYLRRRSG